MVTESTVSLDQWTTLFLAAVIQGLFLSFILFIHKKGNQRANKLLALLIFLFSVMLLYYVSYWTGFATKYVWVNGFTAPFVFLYGPIAFFYVSLLKRNSLPVKGRLHFIPAIVYFIWMIPFLLRNIFGRIEFLRQNFFMHNEFIRWGELIWINFSMISLIAYSVAIHRLIRNRKDVRVESDEIKLQRRWLNRVRWFFTGFAIAYGSYWIMAWTKILKLEYDYAVSGAMSLFIYMVGYIGFRQPEIFNGYQQSGRKTEQKYSKSSLTDEQAKELLIRLLEFMSKEKPYLESELKIQQLAEKMSVSSHHLSQIINKNLQQNFSDFINTYRINEAKRLLLDNKYGNEKILSIAFDSGFHNKATFNTLFKKFTGMSPTEFRKFHNQVEVNWILITFSGLYL